MNPQLAALILASALLVVAVLVAAVPADATHTETPPSPKPARSAAQVVATLVTFVVVVTTSGWLVPALVIASAVWYRVGAWVRRDRSRVHDVERTDALASWIENLRDVLLAGDQPIGAIAATVPSAPPMIRPAVRRLSAALGHQDPGTAFRRFADELDDPLGDLIAAGLLIAVERGARTVAVLTSLAAQARTQADRRRIVDAERAPIQREVMLLSFIMGGLVIVLVVFGRGDYLAPYDTPAGQTFLTVVLAIYAVLLARVQRLARFPKPSRFLSGEGRTVQVGTGALP